MNKQAKIAEAKVLDCLARLQPHEKPIFVEMIGFVAAHPGSVKLLEEAVTRGHKELSEMFAYLQDNWTDPEPAH